MQVKKFEAPTLQEALENVKLELGPEAIILQTKKNRKGFGLMSKSSVEVTAAVSERSLTKKILTESKLNTGSKTAVKKLKAERQADFFDKYTQRHMENYGANGLPSESKSESTETWGKLGHLEKASATQDRVEVNSPKQTSRGGGTRPITATRYIDIEDSDQTRNQKKDVAPSSTSKRSAAVEVKVDSALLSKQVPESEVKKRQALEEEVRELRALIESRMNPESSTAFEQLVFNGVDRRVANALIRKVNLKLGHEGVQDTQSIMDGIVVEMLENIRIAPLFPSGEKRFTPIAVLGPSGVGKTTTVAKLAWGAVHDHQLKVGLVHYDPIGGQDPRFSFNALGTYSKILQVPFRSVSTKEDMKAALSDFQSLDLVLIDTAGGPGREPEALAKMDDFLKAVPGLVSVLVLSTTTRDTELYDTVNQFTRFQPKGIVMSKLDEAVVFGSIYNVSLRSNLPLLYFTTGKKVPGDIEQASGERVVSLIIDI